MDPLHLEVRPYIQSWAHWKKKKKNPLGFIFPASAILLWVCSEICFHQADSIRELGNEKSAMESDGWEEGWGWGVWGGGIVQRRAGRNGREGRSNSYLKRAYPSCFLDFIIRYVWDNPVEWNKVILPPQKAESPWSSQCSHVIPVPRFSVGVQEWKYGINRLIVTKKEFGAELLMPIRKAEQDRWWEVDFSLKIAQSLVYRMANARQETDEVIQVYWDNWCFICHPIENIPHFKR